MLYMSVAAAWSQDSRGSGMQRPQTSGGRGSASHRTARIAQSPSGPSGARPSTSHGANSLSRSARAATERPSSSKPANGPASAMQKLQQVGWLSLPQGRLGTTPQRLLRCGVSGRGVHHPRRVPV